MAGDHTGPMKEPPTIMLLNGLVSNFLINLYLSTNTLVQHFQRHFFVEWTVFYTETDNSSSVKNKDYETSSMNGTSTSHLLRKAQQPLGKRGQIDCKSWRSRLKD